jgi:regulator of RNase E activity RraA
MTSFERLPRDVLARFAALPTSTLSDALDRLRTTGAVEGLRPTLAGSRMAGQAVTLLYLPVGIEGGTVGDYLHLAEPGDVLALDNRGRTDCTVWGNILTEVAKKKGLAGTVIDGVNRDINESRDIGYPIWARASHMLTGKDRVMLQAVNVPVCLGRIRVEAGDVIAADDNGVVVIPRSRAERVLAVAETIEAEEQKILDEVRAGVDLAQARRKHGYHALQRAEAEPR